MNKNSLPLIIILILIIAGLFYYKQKNQTSLQKETENTIKKELAMNEKKLSKPEMLIDKNKNYGAILHTDKGDITIDLYADKTTYTVNNFIYLAKNNFYDKTIFHRVIDGFMIQGGDPKGDGTGGPGYKFPDEPFSGSYDRGVIAMANSGPNTNGSQFFIMHADYPLPANYVIFGKVSAGLEVVDLIAMAKVKTSSSGEMSTPVEPVVINSVEIVEE